MTDLLVAPALGVLLVGAFALTGVVAGLLAGLLGVGGGIVVVPVLFNLFPLLDVPPDQRMHLAVGTSLAALVPTSLVSAVAHRRQGDLDARLLRRLAPGLVLGVLLGAVIGGLVDGRDLTLIFGLVALIVSVEMAVGRPGRTLADRVPSGLPGQGIAAGIGGFSTLMGIGGGTLGVPIFTLCGLEIRRAVGTAAAIGAVIGLPGAVGFMVSGFRQPGLPPGSLGYVSLVGVAFLVPTGLLLAPLGARLSHGISRRALRLAFALFLFATSARMLYGVLA